VIPINSIELLSEKGGWKGRKVQYWAGSVSQILELIPTFRKEKFSIGGSSATNPHFDVIVREPLTPVERNVPLGIVSKSYFLLQHRDLVGLCCDAIKECGLDPSDGKCVVGLTELGEWMHFRFCFPSDYDQAPDGNRVGIRFECFNSVEGSSRLVVFLGWIRFICSNGMIVGKARTTFSDIHDIRMKVNELARVIRTGLQSSHQDIERFREWSQTEPGEQVLVDWVDGILSKAWGKKAAARVLNICRTGCEAEFTNPFAPGNASEKPVEKGRRVPGAPIPAQSLYDVSQALSWVASRRSDVEEQVDWQVAIPHLVEKLRAQVQ